MHVKIQFCGIKKNEYSEPAECKNKSLNKVKRTVNSGKLIEYKLEHR